MCNNKKCRIIIFVDINKTKTASQQWAKKQIYTRVEKIHFFFPIWIRRRWVLRKERRSTPRGSYDARSSGNTILAFVEWIRDAAPPEKLHPGEIQAVPHFPKEVAHYTARRVAEENRQALQCPNLRPLVFLFIQPIHVWERVAARAHQEKLPLMLGYESAPQKRRSTCHARDRIPRATQRGWSSRTNPWRKRVCSKCC